MAKIANRIVINDMKVTIELDPESGYRIVTRRTATLSKHWHRRVEVSSDFKARYNRVAQEYNNLQRELNAMYQAAAKPSESERGSL